MTLERLLPGHLQRLAGLDDPDGRREVMRLEPLAQSTNRVVRRRRHVAKRSPVIRHEDARAKSLEQRRARRRASDGPSKPGFHHGA